MLQGYFLPAAKRMPGRQDGCQLIRIKGHGADVLVLGLIFDEADVDGIVQHPALDEGGIVDLRFRPHLRELLLEAVQQLRQEWVPMVMLVPMRRVPMRSQFLMRVSISSKSDAMCRA